MNPKYQTNHNLNSYDTLIIKLVLLLTLIKKQEALLPVNLIS